MITDGDGILHDKIVQFPGCWVGFKQTSLLSLRQYVTFGGCPTRATLRRMKKEMDASRVPLECQIDLTSPRAEIELKFAQFFGFRPVKRISNVVQMERN